MTSRSGAAFRDGALLAVLFMLGPATPAGAGALVPVQFASPMKHLASSSNPGLGVGWIAEAFNDSFWPNGTYGVGYERVLPGAGALIRTAVPPGVFSVYTRTRFTVDDPSAITTFHLGTDYDDGFVAWINGVKVARSPEMPPGDPAWNTNAASHESSNGTQPNYGTLLDITALALPALHTGVNVLAIGVWNNGAPSSSDLVLVPYLAFNLSPSVIRGPICRWAPRRASS